MAELEKRLKVAKSVSFEVEIAILRKSGGEVKGFETGITDNYCDIIATNKLLTSCLEKIIEG